MVSDIRCVLFATSVMILTCFAARCRNGCPATLIQAAEAHHRTQDHIAGLQHTLSEKNHECSSLRTELEKAQNAEAYADKQKHMATVSGEAFSAKLNELTVEHGKCARKERKMRDEFRQMRSELRSANEEIVRLRGEVEALRAGAQQLGMAAPESGNAAPETATTATAGTAADEPAALASAETEAVASAAHPTESASSTPCPAHPSGPSPASSTADAPSTPASAQPEESSAPSWPAPAPAPGHLSSLPLAPSDTASISAPPSPAPAPYTGIIIYPTPFWHTQTGPFCRPDLFGPHASTPPRPPIRRIPRLPRYGIKWVTCRVQIAPVDEGARRGPEAPEKRRVVGRVVGGWEGG